VILGGPLTIRPGGDGDIKPSTCIRGERLKSGSLGSASTYTNPLLPVKSIKSTPALLSLILSPSVIHLVSPSLSMICKSLGSASSASRRVKGQHGFDRIFILRQDREDVRFGVRLVESHCAIRIRTQREDVLGRLRLRSGKNGLEECHARGYQEVTSRPHGGRQRRSQ